MGLLKSYFNNTRKPEGLLGRMMVGGMNKAHAGVSDWGMGHLTGVSPAAIVDLGCGGGRNTAELLKRFPRAAVTALDYSPVAVEKTGRVNRKEVRVGRCRVLQGDVSALPFGEGIFDLATAFETVYFWPGPAESFREVCRILKPGGMFLIVNESDGTSKGDEKWLDIIDGLQIYDKHQLAAFLRKAGFRDIEADHDEKRHRLCIIARK